ncbi:MAG TPA: DNA repair protein RecN [Acidimicrobiales bacterium]|nr:DNA repair protein RecN [Acidimicrobiales bacterium]
MLLELRVSDLGVIDDQRLLFGPGMTALTGETGAGKTLIVEAIGLLLGARADAVLVRPGADEAVVEGRFVASSGDETILRRCVPASGRSRAYVDGRMATSTSLAEVAAELVDLHGQHAHQALLAPAEQRRALDRAGAVDHTRVEAAKARLRQLAAEAAVLGGDARTRAREIDLVRFQLEELDAAGLDDPDEEDSLREEEQRLGDATHLREAAAALHDLVAADDGIVDRLGVGLGLIGTAGPLQELAGRVRSLIADATEVGRDALGAAETFEDDPARLAEIGERRRLLADLRGKYGDTLTEVSAYRDEARRRLDELESHAERSAALEAATAAAEAELGTAEEELAAARRAAAGPVAKAIESRLRELALPRARFAIDVAGDRAGSTVTWLLAANPGEPLLPLTKIASGGELARTMLAARLALGAAGRDETTSRTLVFDEVDAGIGGEAAVAVGRALAALARHDQVLVVTHLPQVAAVADHHMVVAKRVKSGRTVAGLAAVDGEARVAELSRMLSGRPDSQTARDHASELLAAGAGTTGPRRRRRR